MGGTDAAQVGLGVRLGSINNMMTAGAIQTTGNSLDVAIQGDGFFRIVADPTTLGGTPVYMYTRAGNFTTRRQRRPGHERRPVTSSASSSIDAATRRPARPTRPRSPSRPDSQSVTIGQNGTVSVTDSAGAVTKVAVRLAGHVPERRRPAARLRQQLDRPRTTRAPRRPTSPARTGSARSSRARSRCPTSTSPRSSPT